MRIVNNCIVLSKCLYVYDVTWTVVNVSVSSSFDVLSIVWYEESYIYSKNCSQRPPSKRNKTGFSRCMFLWSWYSSRNVLCLDRKKDRFVQFSLYWIRLAQWHFQWCCAYLPQRIQRLKLRKNSAHIFAGQNPGTMLTIKNMPYCRIYLSRSVLWAVTNLGVRSKEALL